MKKLMTYLLKMRILIFRTGMKFSMMVMTLKRAC